MLLGKPAMAGKLDLSDVTICAADCVNTGLAARSLHQSMDLCTFADAILFTNVPAAGAFRTVQIEQLGSRADYSRFVLKDLPRLIETPFVLITQWDGYVLEPNAWRSEFRQYDYIGAKWFWHSDGLRVGNGGFSLRSRRLMRALSAPEFTLIPDIPEDTIICRAYRPRLELEYGIRFAPEEVADMFSYERSTPALPTFGFHGFFNMWRHVDEAEMIEMADNFKPDLCLTSEFSQLVMQYFILRKFGPLRALYAKLSAAVPQPEIYPLMLRKLNNPALVQECIQTCNVLVRAAASPTQHPRDGRPARLEV
jgi:hypothetical protein